MGRGRGRERSKSAESTTLQGGWHFEAATSAEREKTKTKLKTWQTGKLKVCVGGSGGAVGASLVNFDPKLFMIKTLSHSWSHSLPFLNGNGTRDQFVPALLVHRALLIFNEFLLL